MPNKNMQFKHSPNSPWHDWQYLPPTTGTLMILKRESEASHRLALKAYLRAKKDGIRKAMPIPHCVFYGERIHSFKFLNGKVWDVEKGHNAS